MNYEEALGFLYERLPMFQRVGAAAIKKDLTNTIRLLDAIGNPHQSLKFVHIAGTNGKGTSAHAMASILQSAGYRTGLYTSPHLKSFTERIRVDGSEIDEAFVAEFVNSHKSLIETVKPSFFEVTVVMAFDYFHARNVDVSVIETGLGGRLDSTNVITPEVSLITMIGNDHADLLGSTLELIASEKAGIIKPLVPVVIGWQQHEVMQVFEEKARQVKAALFACTDYQVSPLGGNLVRQSYKILRDGNQEIQELDTDIAAGYFAKNIPGILKTVDILKTGGFSISDHAILQGFSNIKGITGLKGRMQVLGEKPLVIADISHNEPGLRVLFEQIEQLTDGQVHVVFGVVRDKDIQSILEVLPGQATYYWTQSGVPRSLPAKELKVKAASFGVSGETFIDVNQAIQSAKSVALPADLIVVCGSAFVVAEIDGL